MGDWGRNWEGNLGWWGARILCAIEDMAMLSQAHKCLTSSLLHSSCTRLSLRANSVGNWRRELGFGFRPTCRRLLVTGNLSFCSKLLTRVLGLSNWWCRFSVLGNDVQCCAVLKLLEFAMVFNASVLSQPYNAYANSLGRCLQCVETREPGFRV